MLPEQWHALGNIRCVKYAYVFVTTERRKCTCVPNFDRNKHHSLKHFWSRSSCFKRKLRHSLVCKYFKDKTDKANRKKSPRAVERRESTSNAERTNADVDGNSITNKCVSQGGLKPFYPSSWHKCPGGIDLVENPFCLRSSTFLAVWKTSRRDVILFLLWQVWPLPKVRMRQTHPQRHIGTEKGLMILQLQKRFSLCAVSEEMWTWKPSKSAKRINFLPFIHLLFIQMLSSSKWKLLQLGEILTLHSITHSICWSTATKGYHRAADRSTMGAFNADIISLTSKSCRIKIKENHNSMWHHISQLSH